MKKYISVLLTGLIALQPLAIFAVEPNSSDVLLTTEPQIFSAIVPTELPVYMDKLGVITTVEGATISNTSKGPIMVSDIAVEIKDSNWSMKHFTDDFNKLKVNSNVIGLQFNGDNVTSSGTTELNPAHWPAINGLESMVLNYNAKLTAQSDLLYNVKPVKVVFTLKWYESGKADIIDSGAPLIVGDNKLLAFNFTNIVAEDDAVVWSSSDETVATVKDYDNKGRAIISGNKSCEVTGVGVGTATITGTLKDGTSASINIDVKNIEKINVGTKYVEGNYEYSYGQLHDSSERWITVIDQEGWGVTILNHTKTDYASPLTTIQGKPVTNMAYLFSDSSATTINLIDWDTSNITDMSWMFFRSQATSINGLNSLNTSNVINMHRMFGDNSAINLDLSSFNTSNVIDMGAMFYGSKATSINGLSGFDTSNVTDMSYMFHNSKAISLNLSSFNTSKVTNMNWMFSRSQAKSLDLRGFDTSKVTDMSNMFDNTQVISLDLSSFNTSKVTNMGSMFGNSKVTSLNLSNFDTSNVTYMGSMFGLSQLTELNLSGFNTSKVTNMGSMFHSSKITNLDLSKFDTTKVTNMTGMFFESKIKHITAKTQADANRYKSSTYFPSGITVTVKA